MAQIRQNKKKTMSVMNMGRMLGLHKTASYWLVKKGYFDSIIVGKHIRVPVDSFERWYEQQTHYKKISEREG